MLDICLLGTGGMMPLPNRWLTACLVRYEGHVILIDCGEGTQITMRRTNWSFKSIDAICFTHFHGDHIGGLPGMLLTIGNAGRTEPLRLIGPKGLKHIVEGLLLIAPDLPFPLQFEEIEGPEPAFDVYGMKIRPFRVDHRVVCYGYAIEIHRLPKFQPERAQALGIPLPYWKVLQQGQTVTDGDTVYTPDMVLGPDRKGLKFCYCTDSRPKASISEAVRGADLFICEGMYGDPDKQASAKEKKHMTYQEAARLARDGGVKELWLTHYSPSLVNPKEYLELAQAIFPNTIPGKDRKETTLRFEEP